jgi:cobalamin-dependent methionine synthase I
MLRQQIAKREGRANMCLADFVDTSDDWFGGFAVGIHGIDNHIARFKADNDDYNDISLKRSPNASTSTSAPISGAMRPTNSSPTRR